MRFGGYKRIVLLGGGDLIRKLCLWLKKKDIPVIILTSSRQLKDKIDNLNFKDFCKKNFINYKVVDKLEVKRLRSLNLNPKESLFHDGQDFF